LEKVTLGGVAQWILIRGEDTSNPVLLFLHGGPGAPVMPIAREYNRALEQHFVVVQWDQRGSGKSCDASIPLESFTIDRFVSDASELAQFLAARLHQEKIFLVGHSWGSALGVLAVHRNPNLFWAYVGMGQVVDEARAEDIGLRYVQERARELGNEQAIKELADLKPPYLDDPKKITIQRKWLSEFGGNIQEAKTLPFLRDFDRKWVLAAFRSPDYSLLDLLRFQSDGSRVRWALFREFKQVNLIETAPRLEVPVYFFVGRHDYNTPFELVKEYFDLLDAPRGKEIVWFENSAHAPMFEEPEKYYDVLVNRVLKETYARQANVAPAL
jgi:pimeloyl-ACP methyl ester carboxylesterase